MSGCDSPLPILDIYMTATRIEIRKRERGNAWKNLSDITWRKIVSRDYLIGRVAQTLIFVGWKRVARARLVSLREQVEGTGVPQS
jgi:hypothetical protein